MTRLRLLSAAAAACVVATPLVALAAQPAAPKVVITAPTSSSPAVAADGALTVVTFTTDQPVDYVVGYRTHPVAGGTATEAAFPDALATGSAPAGTVRVPVTLPADPGSYDVVVTARHGNRATKAEQDGAVDTTGPGALDSDRCDGLDSSECLFPFPNDRFTGADPKEHTGRRVNFSPLSMPRNTAGKPVDPTEWNRNDGFSPGSMVLTVVPGLDLARTWGVSSLPAAQQPQLAQISRYEAPEAPIVILDATAATSSQPAPRWPFWSEIDEHANTIDARRALILRPAKNFTEGHRYIVALRNLKDAAGKPIAPSADFAALRSGTSTDTARQLQMNGIFAELGRAGIARSDLYLAWDFTVASWQNIAGRMLHIRDDAFGRILGDKNLADRKVEGTAPSYKITSVTDLTPAQDRATQRRVEGTITVPNYLTVGDHPAHLADPTGAATTDSLDVSAPGARFNYLGSTDGMPVQNPVEPTFDVPFVCNIPRTATAANPAHPEEYGHGLLGSRYEANGGSTEDMRLRNFMPCAVNWVGMAEQDLPNVAAILADASNFPSLADRSQQGFLDFLFLGRALIHAKGLVHDPAFQDGSHQPLFRAGELYYDGNSQGGIMGGALAALSPDYQHAVLGVPGMNYSTLLNRSTDWEGSYGAVFYAAYPNPLDQQLMFALLQMLWDRAEGDGYAEHMTSNPYPNTPPHLVMLQVGYSDHQVSNFAAEVEGRTIGAVMHAPRLAPAQEWSLDPYFGFDTFGTDGAQQKSVFVYWYCADCNNAHPPLGNVPSSTGDDPHEIPRRDNAGSDQKAAFLLTGDTPDVCNGAPCVSTDATRRN